MDIEGGGKGDYSSVGITLVLQLILQLGLNSYNCSFLYSLPMIIFPKL